MPSFRELSLAQFIGYNHAKKGYSIKDLATSMGLKKHEWEWVKSQMELDEFDKKEIDELFNKDKR